MGFAGYALWRFVEAVIGPQDENDARKAMFKRLGYPRPGRLYTGLRDRRRLLVGANQGPEGRTGHRLDGAGAGLARRRLLVGAVGLGVVGAGALHRLAGGAQKFAKRLKGYEMEPGERRWILRLGTVGNIARMIVFPIIGVLLVVAAAQADAPEEVGIDGALRRLAARPYGPILLSSSPSGWPPTGSTRSPRPATAACPAPMSAGLGRTDRLAAASALADRSRLWWLVAAVLPLAAGSDGGPPSGG